MRYSWGRVDYPIADPRRTQASKVDLHFLKPLCVSEKIKCLSKHRSLEKFTQTSGESYGSIERNSGKGLFQVYELEENVFAIQCCSFKRSKLGLMQWERLFPYLFPCTLTILKSNSWMLSVHPSSETSSLYCCIIFSDLYLVSVPAICVFYLL